MRETSVTAYRTSPVLMSMNRISSMLFHPYSTGVELESPRLCVLSAGGLHLDGAGHAVGELQRDEVELLALPLSHFGTFLLGGQKRENPCGFSLWNYELRDAILMM